MLKLRTYPPSFYICKRQISARTEFKLFACASTMGFNTRVKGRSQMTGNIKSVLTPLYKQDDRGDVNN